MANLNAPAGGRIKIHNSDLYIELARAAELPLKEKKPPARPTSPIFSETARSENETVRKSIREASIKEQDEQFKKQTEKKAMAAAEAQEIDFQERLADIYKNNYEIVGPIEEYLSQIETRKHRRKEKLHQDWDDTVFSPLQTAITEIVDATSADDIQKRRRHHLSNYLQECNSKLGVFRDIIIESEYDPLHCRDQNNKRVPPEIMKQINQNSTSPRGRSTVGREVLNVTLWDKIASTPCVFVVI